MLQSQIRSSNIKDTYITQTKIKINLIKIQRVSKNMKAHVQFFSAPSKSSFEFVHSWTGSFPFGVDENFNTFNTTWKARESKQAKTPAYKHEKPHFLIHVHVHMSDVHVEVYVLRQKYTWLENRHAMFALRPQIRRDTCRVVVIREGPPPLSMSKKMNDDVSWKLEICMCKRFLCNFSNVH